jgi:thiol-disulfide isomerase/thioredoxin
VLDLLKEHAAAPRKADEVFTSAVARAKAENKKVFLHFGAPWCGWCHKLEDWMAKPEIAAILAKDFVDLKIDIDRMEGGKAIFENYKKDSAKAGIPWFAFIDPGLVRPGQGGSLITSDAPQGNVGFPAAPEEIAHFKAMLLKAKANMSDADIAQLTSSLGTPSK